ncbi:ubiquinol-cytochrome C chaperone [Marinicauda salina]|uniref:Ubiquinol-cytochrome C chaperone n=1 Tax=Marinicauda salina TaxID=2135793 RepID=A0A2U2BVF1_9PROT|nr:ubiquinol-cytochrome C chaperone family protein [Marinicauda salina]PWE17995.1 ubiquinol-cytochrome C chaperone [Marinicauda salina]
MFKRLFRKGPMRAVGRRLYAQLVEAARRPELYGEQGAPDTVDGRFDMIVLHAAVLMRRLREGDEPGRQAAQAVFDAMFDDMDAALREMGTGDLSVGKKVRKMAEAFYGRAAAYDEALGERDEAALADAIERNLFDAEAADGPGAASRRLASYASACAAELNDQDVQAVIAGEAPRFAELR